MASLGFSDYSTATTGSLLHLSLYSLYCLYSLSLSLESVCFRFALFSLWRAFHTHRPAIASQQASPPAGLATLLATSPLKSRHSLRGHLRIPLSLAAPFFVRHTFSISVDSLSRWETKVRAS